jgi:hypothetical protein
MKIKSEFFNLASELDEMYFPEVKYYRDNKNTVIIHYSVELFNNGCLTYNKLITRLSKACTATQNKIHSIVSKYIADFEGFEFKETIKKDRYKTHVLFLIEEPEGDLPTSVFAFFPAEKYNSEPNLFTCYAHIGQHSACHLAYANECKQANYNEYQDLLKELIGLGYNLNVLNSQTCDYHRKPTDSEIRFGYGATHHIEFTAKYFLKKDGNIKKRIKFENLIYTR